MADRLTKEQRHRNMSHVKSKDNSLEIKVRSYLFRKGFRYRKNVKKLPGTPDIVLSKYKTVIFVNGCFWHQHQNCKKAALPATRYEWWKRKLTSNIVNDKLYKDELINLGWKVIVVWQCELEKDFQNVMERLVSIIRKNCKNTR